jgi:hypothetical protein
MAFFGGVSCLLRGAFPILLTALVLLAPAHSRAHAQELQALNEAALAAYSAGRQQMLLQRGPVIVVGRDIVLLANGKEVHADYTPDSYTNLKTLAHITLGTIGLLQAYLDDPAAHLAKWQPHLERLRTRTRAVEPLLGEIGSSDDALARDRFMMQRLLAFMDSVLERRTYSREELTATARELAPFLLASADEAARAQIDLLHSIVSQWRAGLSPTEWNSLRVFVLGSRMPRNGYLQFNYFRFAMGEDAVDKRLIYGENINDPDGALALLGSILADRSIGTIAFADEGRLERDLLADGAEAYLLELFGKRGKRRP